MAVSLVAITPEYMVVLFMRSGGHAPKLCQKIRLYGNL